MRLVKDVGVDRWVLDRGDGHHTYLYNGDLFFYKEQPSHAVAIFVDGKLLQTDWTPIISWLQKDILLHLVQGRAVLLSLSEVCWEEAREPKWLIS